MATNLFEDVGEFQRKFKLPEAAWTGGSRQCHTLTDEEFRYRFNFMHEELREFDNAFSVGDQASMLDALVDLVYVALGTAHHMGAPFNEAWAMVHEANMKKVLVPSEGGVGHKRGNAEVIRKPHGWKPPNLAGLWKMAAVTLSHKGEEHDNDRA